MTQAAGLEDRHRRIFEEFWKSCLVNFTLPVRQRNAAIRRRYIARPTHHPAILFDRLGFYLPRHLNMDRRISWKYLSVHARKYGVL